ncbi:zinc carboxypeptidase [Gillisia sp. Hel_I_86]|uniref:M14 family metallopeptidase n=1 Tax=Gillisia sp. Hel_I_86 TaxID=1249981 RepID=UPI0011991A48|nr:M14 family metallopeptidase [Gillisia sp. Hel_I_86]TVZ27639.1 zinc carboxypeptidase [Gillisia sp. Hel_I_86]
MKKIVFLFVSIYTLNIYSQKPVFKGQEPIEQVSTVSKPVQKQWKGIFPFEDGSVYFSNDFEGGRLNGIIKDSDGTYTALITSENTPINVSPWYAFKVWSKHKKQIYLTLTYSEGFKHRYYPKLSNDGLHWISIDSTDYVEFEKGDKNFGPGSLPLKVQMKLSVNPDTLWVSAQELQTSKHVKKWVEALSEKPFVSNQQIGLSKEGRPLMALTIGKEKTARMLIIISRQHPPEVTGYLSMKAFVETLSSDLKLAKKFRKKFTIYVVPLMNPDGVDNGYWRHNAGGIDLNRDWTFFNQPETLAVSEFIKETERKTNGKFYFGIDFHSTWDDIYYTIADNFKGNMPGLVPGWLENVKKEIPGYNPNIRPSDNMEPAIISRNYFYVAHGMEALVFEIGDNTDRDFLKKKGQTSAIELMKLMLSRL